MGGRRGRVRWHRSADQTTSTADLRHRTGSRPGSRLPADRRVRVIPLLPPRVRWRAHGYGGSDRRSGLRQQRELGLPPKPRRTRPVPLADPRAHQREDRLGRLLRGHAGQAPDHRRGRRGRLSVRGRILRARHHARPGDRRGDGRADRGWPHHARRHRARVRSVPPRGPHQGAQRHLNALSLFLLLDLALVAGAAVLLLLVVIGRGRPGQYLSLAVLLIALALGVWYTTIRSPVALP